MKIIGNTIGLGLPKPNLMQTDPKKGDYVHGKEEFLEKAGSGGLPIPVTAAVGQYIVVSAVDENGAVTATEAVTMVVEALEDAEGVLF